LKKYNGQQTETITGSQDRIMAQAL